MVPTIKELRNFFWLTATYFLFYLGGCAVAPKVIPPQAQIVERVIAATEGVDISVNGRSCHAKNWNEAWPALGKMIRRESVPLPDGLCASPRLKDERTPASEPNKVDK